MRRLELYAGGVPTLSLIEAATPIDRSALPPVPQTERGRLCTACNLGPGNTASVARVPCLAATGDSGGLMVVGGAPSREDDTRGEPFVDAGGRRLRQALARHWRGPVALDSAVRCYPGRLPVKDKEIKACRGFLTQTLIEVEPTRVLALGSQAIQSIFGRSVVLSSTRRAYGYLRANWVQGPVPVFMVQSPREALQNRFAGRWFDEDIEWALTAPSPPQPPWNALVNVVQTPEDARAAVEELASESDWVSFDVETAGRMWSPQFKIISVALCGSHSSTSWVWSYSALLDPACFEPLRRLLTAKSIPKLGQNVKYDCLAFRAAYDLVVTPIHGDTRLWRKLMEPEADGKLAKMVELVGMGGLKEEAEEAMARAVAQVTRALKDPPKNKPKVPIPQLEDLVPPEVETVLRLGGKPDEYKFWLMPPDTLHRYNGRDSVGTKCLGLNLEGALSKEPELMRMWNEVVQPASVALEQVEAWGVAVDMGAITSFDAYLEVEERKHKAVLDQYGTNVNWESVPQVRDLLFNKLRLPELKKTKKGDNASTDSEVLEYLRNKHPLPAALLDFRHITKMRGTYALGMMEHVMPDGRIHPNIKLDGARSGRLSCTDPNLQNIPRAKGSPEGKMARDCFIAPPGYMLLEVDYSQLELRIAAMLSKDEKMRAIFLEGVDYHLRTAQLISKIAWGIDPSMVDGEHRDKSKSVNFGVLYGKTARGLAEEWGVSVEQAQTVVDAILGHFKKLQRWCDEQKREARQSGFVWTWWDGQRARRRPLWRVAELGHDDRASGRRSVAENGAVNSPIQGTASDFCTRSLAAVVQWILGDGVPGVKLVLAIHDALLLEVREDMLHEVAQQVSAIMLGWNSDGIPLEVECKAGKAWGSMRRYDRFEGKFA